MIFQRITGQTLIVMLKKLLGWRLRVNRVSNNSRRVHKQYNRLQGSKLCTFMQYKSANTDVLTRIILTVSAKTPQQHIEDIADAVVMRAPFT